MTAADPLEVTPKPKIDLVQHGYDAEFELADHAEIANVAIDRMRRCYSELVSYGGVLYGYSETSGTFEQVPDDQVRRLIKGFSGKPVMGLDKDGERVVDRRLHVSSGMVGGVLQLVHVELCKPRFFDDAPAGVAFADVFVRLTKNGVKEEPLSPEHRARHRYNFPFSGAPAPLRFFGFLAEVFRDDPDRDAKIAAVQEFTGAAITGLATRYERALMLFGPGANGKSALSRIIEATMPAGAATSIPPSLWKDQYQRPLLMGARLNVVPDLTHDELGPAAKGIISGEGVAARDPGGKAVSFKPTCAHLFGCNTLPHTKDTSAGFWRRWLIVPMTRNFLDDPNRDPHIVAKIVPAELAGIVRWALEGAVRLAQHAEYTLPTSHELAVARWRGIEDAVRLFVETQTEPDPQGTSSTELHSAFIVWAQPFGAAGQASSADALGRKLVAMGVAAARVGSGSRYRIKLKSC